MLLLALCYIALADHNCFVFGKSCRYILLISIIFSCFLGYGFTYLTKNGYLRISRIPNSKPKSRNNPKKLNWCGSVQQCDMDPSQSLKLSIKQATIFITFGLALSPVLYKVITYQWIIFNTLMYNKIALFVFIHFRNKSTLSLFFTAYRHDLNRHNLYHDLFGAPDTFTIPWLWTSIIVCVSSAILECWVICCSLPGLKTTYKFRRLCFIICFCSNICVVPYL